MQFIRCDSPERRNRISRYLLLLFIVGFIITSLVWAYLIANPSSLSHIKGMYNYFLWVHNEVFSKGVVINGRPSTYLAPPHRWFDYFRLIVVRFFYYFYFISPKYSLIHRLTILLGHVFALYLFYRLFSRANPLSKKIWWIAWISFSLCFCYGWFHSFTDIDGDMRYQITIFIPLALFVTLGFYEWIRNNIKWVNKNHN